MTDTIPRICQILEHLALALSAEQDSPSLCKLDTAFWDEAVEAYHDGHAALCESPNLMGTSIGRQIESLGTYIMDLIVLRMQKTALVALTRHEAPVPPVNATIEEQILHGCIAGALANHVKGMWRADDE